jgi:hypothetical protein
MSRLTFREKQTHIAWQKQLRDKYNDEGVPAVPHLDIRAARVRRISRKLAEQVILKYEWLGSMASTGHHYGIFFGIFCAGVCCYANGSGTGGVNVHRTFGVDRRNLSVLARGACVHWSPKGANSKLVSFSLKLLKRDLPNVKLVIAYSDTDAGEIGTIYQACNWVCIGKGASTTQFIDPNGRIYDKKIVYNIRINNGLLNKVTWTEQRDALLENGWTTQKSNPKYRYVYILDKKDKKLVQKVDELAQPYPKRADVV